MRSIATLNRLKRTHCVYAALVLVALVIAGAATAASAYRARSAMARRFSRQTETPVLPATSVAQLGQTQSRLEAERITIRPTGFEPVEINRPAGRFLLAVNDRSGRDSVVITLLRESGERLHEVRMRERPRKHEWRQVVNLPPGRYVLREAGHPAWMCRITLTGN